MKIDVSIGEAIDKLNILELKYKKITNKDKLIEIKKEIDVNDIKVVFSKNTYHHYLHIMIFFIQIFLNLLKKN